MAKQGNLKAVKKRNGRFLVKKRGGGKINGADKVAFLVEQGLVKQPAAKKTDAAPAEA